MFTEVVTLVTLAIFWGRFEAGFLTTDPPSSEALPPPQAMEGGMEDRSSFAGDRKLRRTGAHEFRG